MLPNSNSDLRVFQSKARRPCQPLDLGCRLLRLMLQDGNLLGLLGVDAKSLLGKEMVVRAKELEPPKVVESGGS